ncbi:MAG: hypothetical protein AABX89_01025 [Candidatus Thermoplasmatota archaeon]
MRHAVLALLVLLLAGCAGEAPVEATEAPQAEGMVIAGLVQSATFVGLPGALVQLGSTNVTQVTDGLGLFQFPPQTPGTYPITVTLAGYEGVTIIAQPGTNERSLEFILVPDTPRAPFQRIEHVRGILECAAQAALVGGSCDETLPAGPLLQNSTSFSFPILRNWETIVVDVVFDPERTPGLDGLDIVVAGREAFGEPFAIARSGDAVSFTIRLDPEGAAAGGEPLAGVEELFLRVEPRGFAQDALCGAGQMVGQCPSGVGLGLNVEFDLYLAAFYLEAAPEGFSLRPEA